MTTSRDAPELSGIVRVLIAVSDLEHAHAVYGRGLGMEVGAPVDDRERGVRYAVCSPPEGGEIHLVAVLDRQRPLGGSIASFLETRRDGMYALELESSDLEATEKSLVDRGLQVADGAQDGLEIAPASAYGARLRIVAS